MAQDIIQEPIGLAAKVAKTLGTSKMSAGALCTHLSINKWAKCKPFNSSVAVFASEGDRETARRAVNYGLKLPTLRTSGKYTVFDMDSWTYVARTAPYRTGDFIGYYHGAKMPFEYIKNITVSTLFDENVVFFKNTLGYNADTCVPVIDMLKSLLNEGSGNVYIGAYLYDKDRFLTFKETDGGCKVNDILSYAVNGAIRFNLFATNIAKETIEASSSSNARFLPMPWVSSIEDTKGTITIDGSDPFKLSQASNFTGVRRSGGSYVDPTMYIDQIYEMDQLDKYYPIGGNWYLQLRFQLTNNSETTKHIYASKITVKTESTFYNDDGYTGGVKVFNGGGFVNDTIVSVAPGEKKNLEVQLSQGHLFGNSQPPSGGKQKNFSFKFMYDGKEWFTRKIRLSSNSV